LYAFFPAVWPLKSLKGITMSYLSFALDARVSIALHRVAIVAGDLKLADSTLSHALRLAKTSGTACASEDENACCPALVADDDVLRTVFTQSFEVVRDRNRALRTPEGIAAELGSLASSASAGCGSVYELFEKRFSESVDDLISTLESPYQAIAIELARPHGYCTVEERTEAEQLWANDRSCWLTGMDPWCCPCGRHE
jgi:hypothetical protein